MAVTPRNAERFDSSGNLLVSFAKAAFTNVSTPAQNTIGTTAEQILGANPSRQKFILQNVGTTVIKIAYGTTTPTQSNYHIALPACGSENDGSSFLYEETQWLDEVQAISSGAGGLLQVAEFE
jgi:hypothetical protein